jgi:NAD(P)-dependent dehydrogenase (short-subunit alcohol dehydrogenase family)
MPGLSVLPRLLAEVGYNEWNAVLATNLTGVWLCMKYEIAHMRAHGGGVIVNTASNIGAHRRMPSMGAYAATKAGGSALTHAAALEYTGAGIRINAVSPGPVDTGWFQAPDGSAEGENTGWDPGAGLPIGRVASMDEISNAVLWLASPGAGFVVGHDLVIDGGASS